LLAALYIWCNDIKAFSGGSGTQADPYQIATAGDLHELAAASAPSTLSSWFKLVDDVNMLDETISPIGTMGNPFTGTFLGDNHQIENLLLVYDGLAGGVGLFGAVAGV